MNNNFMTWEDWEAPSSQLKCLIQDLVCGTDCYKPVVNMSLANDGYVTFTGPNGALVFKAGGISTQTDNSIIASTLDGLPYFKETITTIDSLAISGTDLAITSTNETGVASSKSVPLSSICTACAAITISPAAFISADLNNSLVLGTDGKLYNPVVASASAIPQTNRFSVTAGSSVTLTHTPLATHHVLVFRNGIRQELSVDYTIVGVTITFATAFGDTLNSDPDGETIIVDYFRI